MGGTEREWGREGERVGERLEYVRWVVLKEKGGERRREWGGESGGEIRVC